MWCDRKQYWQYNVRKNTLNITPRREQDSRISDSLLQCKKETRIQQKMGNRRNWWIPSYWNNLSSHEEPRNTHLWNYLFCPPFKGHPKKNWIKIGIQIMRSKNREKPSRFEGNGQPKPGIFIQGLGINLTRNSEHWLWYDLMLQEGPKLSMIVEPCFDLCQIVNSKRASNCKSVLICGEPSNDLCNRWALLKLVQMMEIRCFNGVTLVPTDWKAKHVKYQLAALKTGLPLLEISNKNILQAQEAYRIIEADESGLVTLIPAVYLVKPPDVVS